MLETKDLILDKAKPSDWEAMYRNVWSHPESAKYMYWSVTASEDDARARMERTIAFQASHDTYLVYEKASGEAIGFAGIAQSGPGVYEETGICLGPRFVRKGYGRQIVSRLIRYCKDLGAEALLYSTWETNEASKGLARTLGFTYLEKEDRIDERNGAPYIMLRYILKLK